MNVHFMQTIIKPPAFRKQSMQVLVFKTNLQYEKDLIHISPLLGNTPGIIRWNVDQHDVDNVHEQEEVDRDTGDAVQHPRPHSLAAAVQRSRWTSRHPDFWCGERFVRQGTRRLLWHEQPSLRRWQGRAWRPTDVR